MQYQHQPLVLAGRVVKFVDRPLAPMKIAITRSRLDGVELVAAGLISASRSDLTARTPSRAARAESIFLSISETLAAPLLGWLGERFPNERRNFFAVSTHSQFL